MWAWLTRARLHAWLADAQVGRRVFNRCIKGYLRHKTVVLATNQLQFVEDTDLVLFLKVRRCLLAAFSSGRKSPGCAVDAPSRAS